MGIKGIFGEIGPGERTAFSKLAVETFEKKGRCLRVAIDISIWQFQIQSGRGGSNPALRTLYFRLLRLLSLAVHPLFVFDGPNKPPWKRGKKTSPGNVSLPNFMTKQMLKLFGFPFHTAPGEAEAECALLQRESIVDAVLSEDVDTLMFGCGMTLRNWAADNARGNHAPTHVSIYHAKKTKEGKSELDREGMILVALMSGGDYIQEGVPGCGIKVACEAARAGFGSSLCKSADSNEKLATWRSELCHELQSNESKFFRVKHKALRIPDDFPNREVLGYYTHPVVSSTSKLTQLKREISWDSCIDIEGLRSFVAEAFEWTHKAGAIKFLRGLAPVLLVRQLLTQGDRRASGLDDLILTQAREMTLVRAIQAKRTHFSTDGIPELRLIFHPLDIVPLDLDAEPEASDDYDREGLATSVDEEAGVAFDESDEERPAASQSPSKRSSSKYDPTAPAKVWVPESLCKIGIPLKVQDYEESLRNPKKFLKQKALIKKAAATKGGMQQGALDRFVTVTKPTTELPALKPTVVDVAPLSQVQSPIETVSAPKLPDIMSPNITTRKTRAKLRQAAQAVTRVQVSMPANPWAAIHGSSIQPTGAQPLAVTKFMSCRTDDKSSNVQPALEVPTLTSPGKHVRVVSPVHDVHLASPQKKRSPGPAINLITPSPTQKTQHSEEQIKQYSPLSAQQSNRKLDFVASTTACSRGKFHAVPNIEDDDDLPNLTSLGAKPSGVSEEQREGASAVNVRTAAAKQVLKIRESLDGAWEIIDSSAATAKATTGKSKSKSSWRMSEVEVLDMTHD